MLNDPGFNLLDLDLVDRAMHVALMSHEGARNKHDDEFYLLHVHRVSVLVKKAGGTELQIAVALLHDTVEDTKTTLTDLRYMFPDAPALVASVDALTKREGEDEDDYRERLAADNDAAFVKFFGDSMDNFRRNRFVKDPEKRDKFAKRYGANFDRLAFSVKR